MPETPVYLESQTSKVQSWCLHVAQFRLHTELSSLTQPDHPLLNNILHEGSTVSDRLIVPESHEHENIGNLEEIIQQIVDRTVSVDW